MQLGLAGGRSLCTWPPAASSPVQEELLSGNGAWARSQVPAQAWPGGPGGESAGVGGPAVAAHGVLLLLGDGGHQAHCPLSPLTLLCHAHSSAPLPRPGPGGVRRAAQGCRAHRTEGLEQGWGQDQGAPAGLARALRLL